MRCAANPVAWRFAQPVRQHVNFACAIVIVALSSYLGGDRFAGD